MALCILCGPLKTGKWISLVTHPHFYELRIAPGKLISKDKPKARPAALPLALLTWPIVM